MAGTAWDRMDRQSVERELEALAWVIESVVRRWSGIVDVEFLDDLRQEARLGAWRAIMTYQPERGVRLST